MKTPVTPADNSPQLRYQSGFGNEFATEALAGALPEGQNSPQRAPFGLYAELISGTAFTAPRANNRRTWTYRLRPSAAHPRFKLESRGNVRGTPFQETDTAPDRLRWDPMPLPGEGAEIDFIGQNEFGRSDAVGIGRGNLPEHFVAARILDFETASARAPAWATGLSFSRCVCDAAAVRQASLRPFKAYFLRHIK